MSETVLEGLVARLRAALTNNPNAYAAPVALLWPDEGRQWQPAVHRLAEQMPIITLGDYDPAVRTGPAYWLRCVVAGTIDAGLMDGPPVVYMPGVARSALRAVDTCPADLAPIAELQYRSQWFSHPNSRDWSVRALLVHPERGLGLIIADDADTTAALLLALDRVLDERIDRVAKQVLDADYFRDLINPDPVRSLLGWLDDPPGYRRKIAATEWVTFVQQCKADFGFDPTLDGAVTAAAKLGARKGAWANAWKRFAETPQLFPGIPDQLRKAQPHEQLELGDSTYSDVWPQDNEAAEDQLRNRLRDAGILTAEAARQRVLSLDAEHAWRRRTVWADLEMAPLAFSLEQLVTLAELTGQSSGSSDLPSLTAEYAEHGWRADDAMLRALAAVKDDRDRKAVSASASAMYRSWLEASAKALQGAIGPMANAQTYEPGPPASSEAGTVTVFVDGLRLDISRRVETRLTSLGLVVDSSTSLAALPTVTQTSKAALVPVAKGALAAGPDLHPANSVTGTKATIAVLRSLMLENGVQVLGSTDGGDPSGTAWTEAAAIDHRGHDVGSRIVEYLDAEVDQIVGRIRELLDAGWQQVDVVTDHGWILLPDGLEKVELPAVNTEAKKGRCARLKDGAVVSAPTVPWFWNQDVRIALAPGVTCFEANKEYEHGGVSPQECIVPRLTVTAGITLTAGSPEIIKVKWLGLLCRVELAGMSSGITADLRALPADPKTSIAERAKETSGAGRVSLVVPDEEHVGERAFVVLLAPDGQVLAQREVVVGSNR